ncbi:hypothetical protein KI387_001923, partial [Taxus chinensis]
DYASIPYFMMETASVCRDFTTSKHAKKGNIIDVFELENDQDFHEERGSRDWKSLLLVEYAKNKFAHDAFEGKLSDEKYKVISKRDMICNISMENIIFRSHFIILADWHKKTTIMKVHFQNFKALWVTIEVLSVMATSIGSDMHIFRPRLSNSRRDKRLSGTMELMSEGGLKERIIRVGKKLKRPHHSEDALLKDLEETANCLAMVEQSDKYMIQPLMFQLIKPRIFWHEDVRVKIMVTCIAEVTRVTAPNLPYSDDIMRDIFEHMVGIFQGLWNVASPYHNKRVKILETMVEVRSSVLMLDLGCNDLILHMFEVFFGVIQDNHSENIMVAMQTIMSTVIDEYNNIPQHLLDVLKEELRQEATRISHTLAKGVMN